MVILRKEQQRAIELLYKRMYKPLFAYAHSTFNDRAAAEEAVQDTFQIACLKADALAASPNPEGWLMKTLKYVMSNMRQRQATKEALFVTDRALDENIVSLPSEISVETEASFLAVLGETDYKMLKRVALKEATIRETAQEFGLSEEACSKRIQRSKAKLRALLQENENRMSEKSDPDTYVK